MKVKVEVDLTRCEINPLTVKHHKERGDSEIECFLLNKDAQLHRFLNRAGVEYSAIYMPDGFEIYNAERAKEAGLLSHFLDL